MKLNIPKIIRPLTLDTYANELEGIELHVWVNPTRVVLDENQEIQNGLAKLLKDVENITNDTELDDEQRLKQVEGIEANIDSILQREREWWVKILSQSSNASTHWTEKEIEILDQQDTALWQFIRLTSSQMIRANREDVKKGLLTSS